MYEVKQPGLHKMSTVAQRTGLGASLLRAWERRHGLLEPERTEGGHRLYTEDDLHVLEQVQRLLGEGRSIGEIASMGRPALLGVRADRAEPPPGSSAHAQLAERLVAGAVAVDEVELERVLDESFTLLSPMVVIEHVLYPALREIGDLWAQGRCSISGEHLASAKIMGRLLKLLEAANPDPRSGAPLAICACLPDERHEIGALVTGYALTRYNHRVTYLGNCLPLEDLERACRGLAPALLCFSVTRAALLETHAHQLVELSARLPRSTRILLGGQGVVAPPAVLSEARLELVPPKGRPIGEILQARR